MSRLLDSFDTRTYRRLNVDDYQSWNHTHDDAGIERAMAYLHRTRDHDIVKELMIARYAMMVVEGVDEISGATTKTFLQVNGVVQKINETQRAAIITGQHEIVTVDTYGLSVSLLASLFSGQYSRFAYKGAVEKEINLIREEGSLGLSQIRWDSTACAVGSAMLYLSISGGKIVEQTISPDKIWIAFADQIETDRGRVPVSTLDIDQATVVVICLGNKGAGQNKYQAWFGPSEEYPMGRCCQYVGSSWDDLPSPGPGVIDYTVADVWQSNAPMDALANPLTVLSDRLGVSLPVYPFVPLTGDPMRSTLMPVSLSLFQNCLEVSLMQSIILGAAGKSAKGVQQLNKDSGATSPDVSNWSEGQIVLGKGLSMTQSGWEAINSKDASEVLDKYIRRLATDNHIPEYLLTRSGASEIPSGVALKQMIEPMNEYRTKRASAARGAVARRWTLEKALINSVDTDIIPIESEEQWHPGEIQASEETATQLANWSIKLDRGIGDIADAVMDIVKLDTKEKAWNWLKERAKDKEKYSELLSQLGISSAQSSSSQFQTPTVSGLRGFIGNKQIQPAQRAQKPESGVNSGTEQAVGKAAPGAAFKRS